MSYVTLFIAWLQMQSSELTGNAWNYSFWSKVVDLNVGAYELSWLIWKIFLVAVIVLAVISWFRGAKFSDLFGCIGCGGILLLLLPLGAWINMVEAQGILHSMTPEAGIVNMTNFVISLLLFILFGVF